MESNVTHGRYNEPGANGKDIYGQAKKVKEQIKKVKKASKKDYMSEKDKLVVESMARTGMDFETLCSCFPQFTEDQIKEVRDNLKNQSRFEDSVSW